MRRPRSRERIALGVGRYGGHASRGGIEFDADLVAALSQCALLNLDLRPHRRQTAAIDRRLARLGGPGSPAGPADSGCDLAQRARGGAQDRWIVVGRLSLHGSYLTLDNKVSNISSTAVMIWAAAE
jgi:hypothetical protein